MTEIFMLAGDASKTLSEIHYRIVILTKLLSALVHWLMCNNLLTILNKYPAIHASRDFDVSYTKLKRVITGKKQPRGSYYDRQC